MPSASAKLSPQPLALKEARDEASASVASSADTAVHDEHHVPKDDMGSGPGSARSASSAPASSRGRLGQARATPLPVLATRGASDSDLLTERRRGAYLGNGGAGHAQPRERGAGRSVAVVCSAPQVSLASGMAVPQNSKPSVHHAMR
eukprot:2122617-Rhodomonas_salina.1